jgi:hypothetical protein
MDLHARERIGIVNPEGFRGLDSRADALSGASVQGLTATTAYSIQASLFAAVQPVPRPFAFAPPRA